MEAGIAGGRAGLAPILENFPGFPEGIKGSELIQRMRVQAERFEAVFRGDEEVVGLEVGDGLKRVVTRKQVYEASAVVIATGTQRRKLRVEGETEFLGRGVSHCAVCDGPFFRDKAVAVVGNSEEAATDALSLADLASKVTLVSQDRTLEIEGTLLGRLKGRANVEFVNGKVTQIIGEKVVGLVKIQVFDGNEIEREVKGVFIALGGVPMTAIVQKAGIKTDRNGCLTVDRYQHTNVGGVFAAGDCTCGGMQVVTAAGRVRWRR